ncbi:MAG: hypothetical protein HY069_04790 [Chlamydiia bacterium]|nr:hypothetical protein [Chlamydiia bacterium]
MTLPLALQVAIEEHLQGISLTQLKKEAEGQSSRYRGGQGSVFQSDAQCLAYLASRVPATYGAVEAVLRQMGSWWRGSTLLDLGAGPGTAGWAAWECFPFLVKPVLVERSAPMIRWGKKLAAHHPVLANAEWIQGDLLRDYGPADLVIVSYALGELAHPLQILDVLWQYPLAVVIEPGTPQGFERIRQIRTEWLQRGGFLIAPCPHALACPMTKGDWCHFSARIPRTKIHRLLKSGDLGYEDEKFSYLILSRTSRPQVSNRILRHPIQTSGQVQLVLCTHSGEIEKKSITRKEGEIYKAAKHAKWGDGSM